jgi:hypothetical protein
MARSSAAERKARSGTVRPLARPDLVRLLDEDQLQFSMAEWRQRNLAIYTELVARGLCDPELVSPPAHRYLTESLIRDSNPAATDPQNAGHVRAQNENILHYGLWLRAPPDVLTVALEAGYIHDLNKAVSSPLRRDRWAVRSTSGVPHLRMRTLGESVALNHLGEGTRACLEQATRLEVGALSPDVAERIDRCIVHHGLGSSRFIQELLEGNNEWWGHEFVEPASGRRLLVHPPQPPLTLESVLHDLADSTQQMQGGLAWLAKYPAGFWRDVGRSYWEMLSQDAHSRGGGIPLSLRLQVDSESETCRRIIRDAELAGLIGAERGRALRAALASACRGTEAWIDDRAKTLAKTRAPTVYHDVGRALGISAARALARLKEVGPGSPGAAEIEPLLWASARRLDLQRVRALADLLIRAGPRRAPRRR